MNGAERGQEHEGPAEERHGATTGRVEVWVRRTTGQCPVSVQFCRRNRGTGAAAAPILGRRLPLCLNGLCLRELSVMA